MPRTPTVRFTVSILPWVASFHSMGRVLATSLDFDMEEEEEVAFHELNRCRMMMLCSPVKKHLDPMWQMVKWLQACEEGLGKEEISWWLLLLPLTDGGNMATKELTK